MAARFCGALPLLQIQLSSSALVQVSEEVCTLEGPDILLIDPYQQVRELNFRKAELALERLCSVSFTGSHLVQVVMHECLHQLHEIMCATVASTLPLHGVALFCNAVALGCCRGVLQFLKRTKHL